MSHAVFSLCRALLLGIFWRGSQEVAKTGSLPVVNFAAGGIATPADAALMMQLGVDGEASVIPLFLTVLLM